MLKIYRNICNRVVRYNNTSLSLSSVVLSSSCSSIVCRHNKLLLSSSLSSLASSSPSQSQSQTVSSSSSSSSVSSSSPTLSSKLNINISTTNDSNDEEDDDDDDDDDDQGKIDLTPKKLSVVHHPYSIEKSKPIELGDLSKEDRFAVIIVKGRQYKVTVDDTIVVNLMDNVDIGEIVTIDDVLLVGSRRTTVIGQPIITNAKVLAQVEEITKDKKVIAFKLRRRKNSKSTVGHRRDVVILRINDIIIDKDIENLGFSK